MTWRFWRWPLANLILIGLIVGAVAGVIVERNVTDPATRASLDAWITHVVRPVGRLFIRIIFMIVVPLIFSAIVLGIAEMGDVRRLGRVGLRSLWFTLLLSGTSVLLGVFLVNALAPGKGMPEAVRLELVAKYSGDAAGRVAQGTQSRPLAETLQNLIPENPLTEAVNAFTPNYTGGGLIAFMVFSVFFGVALTMLPAEKAAPLAGCCKACSKFACASSASR